MRGSRLLAAGLFLVGLATMVEAQRPNRQPGPGGPGGGMFGRGQDVGGLVLTNEALQEELKVTTEQKEKFKPVAAKQEEMQKKMRDLFAGGAKGGKADFEKMREKMADMQKEREKATAEVKALVEGTLTAEQKTRLKQIERQTLGVRAFSNEEVVTALKLTDDQKNKIKGLSEEYAKDARELFQGLGRPGAGGFDAEKMAEMQKKQRRLQRETMEKITESLTQEQRTEWKGMVGEPFDTTKLQPQFRRKD